MRDVLLYILTCYTCIQVGGIILIILGVKWGIILVILGIVFGVAYLEYIWLMRLKKRRCPNCKNMVTKEKRICPVCGYLFQGGPNEEHLTEYIKKEKEKEISSGEVDSEFEKVETIALDVVDNYDGDIKEFLKE